MPGCTRVCLGVRKCVQVCAGVPGCAQVCTSVRGCIRVCVGMHRCTVGGCGCERECAGVHGCEQLCTGVRRFARRYACMGGMNFQNFFWRIESLHQRTLIRILYEFFIVSSDIDVIHH